MADRAPKEAEYQPQKRLNLHNLAVKRGSQGWINPYLDSGFMRSDIGFILSEVSVRLITFTALPLKQMHCLLAQNCDLYSSLMCTCTLY